MGKAKLWSCRDLSHCTQAFLKTLIYFLFSYMCFHYRDRAYSTGKAMCEKLQDSIPRQMFEIAVQAAIGSKVIARET